MNKKKIQGNNCGLCGHNSVLSPGNHGFLSSHRRAASNGCVFARGLWSCFFSGLGPRGKMGEALRQFIMLSASTSKSGCICAAARRPAQMQSLLIFFWMRALCLFSRVSLSLCPVTAVDDAPPVAAASVKPTRPSHINAPLHSPNPSFIYQGTQLCMLLCLVLLGRTRNK